MKVVHGSRRGSTGAALARHADRPVPYALDEAHDLEHPALDRRIAPPPPRLRLRPSLMGRLRGMTRNHARRLVPAWCQASRSPASDTPGPGRRPARSPASDGARSGEAAGSPVRSARACASSGTYRPPAARRPRPAQGRDQGSSLGDRSRHRANNDAGRHSIHEPGPARRRAVDRAGTSLQKDRREAAEGRGKSAAPPGEEPHGKAHLARMEGRRPQACTGARPATSGGSRRLHRWKQLLHGRCPPVSGLARMTCSARLPRGCLDHETGFSTLGALAHHRSSSHTRCPGAC
jgi:hypothetical protein